MLLDSWSLALFICSLVVVFLMLLAGRSAVRVLRFWNPASDDNRQIRLENEIWLTSTLVEYGLGVQILSLVVFVLAADHFAGSIPGAMCATGALLADSHGMPALLVKLGGVFLYGFWLLLHQLDIRSEHYPLVRTKYVYLLLLLPLLAVDITLQTLYLTGLRPDIITSCCAVVFDSSTGGGPLLLRSLRLPVLPLFYGTAALLAVLGLVLRRRWRILPGIVASLAWCWFFGLAMVAIITVFSSYIYNMPYHKCPFCILKPQYHYIGFLLYGTLIPATFFGVTPALIEPFRNRPGLGRPVASYRKSATTVSLLLLAIFTALASYHVLRYLLLGGEG